jgi:hypothetical protein
MIPHFLRYYAVLIGKHLWTFQRTLVSSHDGQAVQGAMSIDRYRRFERFVVDYSGLKSHKNEIFSNIIVNFNLPCFTLMRMTLTTHSEERSSNHAPYPLLQF